MCKKDFFWHKTFLCSNFKLGIMNSVQRWDVLGRLLTVLYLVSEEPVPSAVYFVWWTFLSWFWKLEVCYPIKKCAIVRLFIKYIDNMNVTHLVLYAWYNYSIYSITWFYAILPLNAFFLLPVTTVYFQNVTYLLKLHIWSILCVLSITEVCYYEAVYKLHC